jgi:hypothetical protein
MKSADVRTSKLRMYSVLHNARDADHSRPSAAEVENE